MISDFKFGVGYKNRRKKLNPNPTNNDNRVIRNNFVPFEPMVRNRFLVSFPDEIGIGEYMVQSVDRPRAHLRNGLVEWENIRIDFVDPIVPSVSQALSVFFQGENLMNNVLEFKIQMLDPVGTVVSEWIINGFIGTIDFGHLSYYDENACTVSVEIIVHNVTLNF